MYYALSFADTPGGVEADEEFDELRQAGEYIPDWAPPVFTQRGGDLADFQLNDLLWPLCSEKLKKVIDHTASRIDPIQWLDATVIDVMGRRVAYYILHFSGLSEALDQSKTIFGAEDFVIKPYFSLKAIGEHRVFSYKGSETGQVIIAERVKEEIEATNCSGALFRKVLLSVD